MAQTPEARVSVLASQEYVDCVFVGPVVFGPNQHRVNAFVSERGD